MSGAASQPTSKLGLIALVLAVALLGAVYYKFRDYFDVKAEMTLPLNPACDLRQAPCEMELPNGGRLTFGIEPKTIPLLQPLKLQVAIAGMETDLVEVDFAGIDMNMGYNRTALKGDAGRYQGEATLPVCVRSRMGWEAKVLLHTDLGIVAAPFRFETFK